MYNEELYHTPVKDWYIENFPTDDLGQELPDTLGEVRGDFFAADIDADPAFADKPVTFEDYFIVLDGYGDVYDLMGPAADSLVRERIFNGLAEAIDEDYDYIYEQWLRAAGN
jgi:hypothetical protein